MTCTMLKWFGRASPGQALLRMFAQNICSKRLLRLFGQIVCSRIRDIRMQCSLYTDNTTIEYSLFSSNLKLENPIGNF